MIRRSVPLSYFMLRNDKKTEYRYVVCIMSIMIDNLISHLLVVVDVFEFCDPP